MSDDDTGTEESYDPSDPSPPDRAPPVRETAPQSDFTGSQVAVGALVLAVGLAITAGLPLLLA